MKSRLTKTLRLKNKTIEAVKKQAKLENRNFSNMVETLLIRFFKEEES